MGRMYSEAKTWSPFVGCNYACAYCGPSFKSQAKRQKKNCEDCYHYEPHFHPERLGRIPTAPIVFICAYGDIAFCPRDQLFEIVDAVKKHARRRALQMKDPITYYWQSKSPRVLKSIADHIPMSSALVTTLETNFDAGYELISRAPPPSVRWREFMDIGYANKVLTLEPLLTFDPFELAGMVKGVKPRYVWIGLNSHPGQAPLPEPNADDVKELIRLIRACGIEIRFKNIGEDGLRNAAP